MDEVQIILNKEQQKNLLVMLDSVQIKGLQSAHEYLTIASIIQNAKPIEKGEE